MPFPMTSSIDLLRGELERLFTLDELTQMSQNLLGLDPEAVGGHTAKASFARALTDWLAQRDQLDALIDVLAASRKEVDPKARDLAALSTESELSVGQVFAGHTIERKVSSTDLGVGYLARKAGAQRLIKTLRREASRDRRAANRFLVANRLVARVAHDGLPAGVEAAEHEGVFFVAYDNVDGQALSARFARTGPSHVNELRPVLKAILEPLAALHKAQLVHGDLRMEHVLVGRVEGGQGLRAVLVDFGGDRLRPRLSAGTVAVFGSARAMAPELVRGKSADARTDVYAFGAMLYELLSGKPVFASDDPVDAALAHLTSVPDAPSTKAPRGWVAKDVDAFVLSLLAKDPAARPRDAQELLEAIDNLGKPAAAQRSAADFLSQETVDALVDALVASPDDAEAAMALETAVDRVAEPAKIADAFAMAADQLETSAADYKETKKSLLFRAARIFEHQKDKARAEEFYAIIAELDPDDEVAVVALEEARKAQGKFGEVVELLLSRAEKASTNEQRARFMGEIGRITAHELDDAEQALVAYTQALCELPSSSEYAAEVEHIAGKNPERWQEVLSSLTEAVKGDASPADKNALMLLCGRWYDQKVGRADMALMAYQQILVSEPASEIAAEAVTGIYRKAQQWPELAHILSTRADAAGASPRGRDLRVEAADLYEHRLGDTKRAREIYDAILQDDPGHAKAGEALARIAEAAGDYRTFVTLLERRADARGGQERIDALVKIAEAYEVQLADINEAMRRFESVLAVDPKHLGALRGLDRIFTKKGHFRELLEVLERQIAVAATPRQKLNLFERIAALYDEEFFDHEKASLALEEILKLDAANDGALSGLARHYRAQGKWEDVIRVYERHEAIAANDERRVELMLQRARTLSEQVGSPERAMRAYEQVVEINPGHGGALEALARLKELSGDAHAALSAIEALAAKAQTPELKAEQWLRAAKLLETRGDRDGAIERYKLALESNPRDASASSSLRAAYAARGDASSVVSLIEQELAVAEGNMAKARLHGELARLFHVQLKEDHRAAASAKLAAELDATNADAQLVLGDLAFDEGRFLEASKFYESLAGRTSVLAKEDGVRVLIRYIEAQGKLTAPRPSLLPPPSMASLAPPAPSSSAVDLGAAKSMLPPSNPRVLAAV